MHIVVCVKQIPDTTEVRIDPETNNLDRSSAPAILNPYDSHAVEEAVRLKERFGGKVTVVSMGPPSAAEVIKKCIAAGANAGYLLHDRLFAGSDTLATSYILAQGIRAVCGKHPFDLVICGRQAMDGDTAQVGPGIARRLGIAQITYVKKIESVDMAENVIRVQRKTDEGRCVMAAKMPCLLTVEKDINELRYADLPGMLRAARYRPVALSALDLGADLSRIGMRGSPTKVIKIFPPQRRNQGEILQGEAVDAVSNLVQKLASLLINDSVG